MKPLKVKGLLLKDFRFETMPPPAVQPEKALIQNDRVSRARIFRAVSETS
jgi:hypothetical protein